MRIALFHNLPSGGAKRAIYEWTRRFATDHRVDVYTLSTADHAFCDIRPFAAVHHEYRFRPSRLLSSPFGRWNQVQRWRDLGRLARIERRMAADIDAQGYDVVFAHTCQFTFIPPLLHFLRGPSVYFLHEAFGRALALPIPHGAGRRERFRASLDRVDPFILLYRRRLDRLQARSLGRAARLLANSRFTRDRMQRSYGLDAPVCRYGVDAHAFAPMPALKRGRHVLSVGELSPRKGFGFVIEALGLIPAARRPPLRLACNRVVPAERAIVERLAAERAVDLEIMTGFGTVDLAREYNEAALCVYAPLNEPFGLVPLEAMACGTPVIGISEGGVLESVIDGYTGMLVERDPGQFAHAIEVLLSRHDMRDDYGRNARQHVLAEWTWDRSVRELERQLDLAARSPARRELTTVGLCRVERGAAARRSD